MDKNDKSLGNDKTHRSKRTPRTILWTYVGIISGDFFKL